MILDLGGGLVLRRASAADHRAFERICLETGDAGRDATWREDDPSLMGQVFSVPYQVLEPGFAFAIEGPAGVCGYCLAALDTAAFNRKLARDWYPELQRRVADPGPDEGRWRGSDWVRHQIHHPELGIPEALAPFPSHGHIDLLPEARGKGVGRKAMTFLEGRLADAGSTGIFLQVHPANRDALAFYRALGMVSLPFQGLPGGMIHVGRRFSSIPPHHTGA